MQKGFGIIYILIGILILGLVAGGAYYFSRSNTPQPTSAPLIPPTAAPPIPSVKTTSDETANWKTYTNTKVDFQVKYPPRYPKPALPSGVPGSPIIYTDENSLGDIIFGETSTDSFSVVVFPFKGNLQEIFTTTEAKGRPPYNWTPSENISITSKDTIIDGVNAKWLTASYKMGVKDMYTAIFFTRRGFGFIINPSPNYDEKEINQILSTFKFLDQNSIKKVIMGTVLENNLGCYVDIACYLRLLVDQEEIRVIYNNGEWPPCLNTNTIAQGEKIKAGEKVEVFGKYEESVNIKIISTCDSEAYYIKRL